MSGSGAVKKKAAKHKAKVKSGPAKKPSRPGSGAKTRKPSRSAPVARQARSSRPARSAAAKRPAAKGKPRRHVASTAMTAPQPVAVPRGASPRGAAISRAPGDPRSEVRYAGLTESDLRRAPLGEYMKAGQLAYFRELLRAMQRELLEKADITSEHLREHEAEPDPTDQATIEEEYALELRARDRERKLLKKIEQSLRRIDDGSYGYCEETGEMIGIPRLLARPTATLTIEAQSRRELKQKLYGE